MLLWLARRERPLVDGPHRDLYPDFLTASFGQGGNTIRQCLRGVFTGRQIGRLADNLRFAPLAPPSTLTFDQYLGLSRYLALVGRIARRNPVRGTERGPRRVP